MDFWGKTAQSGAGHDAVFERMVNLIVSWSGGSDTNSLYKRIIFGFQSLRCSIETGA